MNLSHIYEFEKIKSDFIIENDTLMKYIGHQNIVYIPAEFGNIVLGKYAFSDNPNIEKVICFDNVTEIEMFCFENSPRFKEIYITNKDIIIDEFTFSEGFVTVYAPSKSIIKKCDKKIVQYKKIEKNRLCYPKTFNIKNGELKQYLGNADVVETPYFVSKISSGAFANSFIKSLIISSEVKQVDPNAFINCNGLHKVIFTGDSNISNWSAFANCKSITSIIFDIPITTITSEIVGIFDFLEKFSYLLYDENKYKTTLFIYIPKSVNNIEPNWHYKYICIGCERGSYAYSFAKKHCRYVNIYDENGNFIEEEIIY